MIHSRLLFAFIFFNFLFLPFLNRIVFGDQVTSEDYAHRNDGAYILHPLCLLLVLAKCFYNFIMICTYTLSDNWKWRVKIVRFLKFLYAKWIVFNGRAMCNGMNHWMYLYTLHISKSQMKPKKFASSINYSKRT